MMMQFDTGIAEMKQQELDKNKTTSLDLDQHINFKRDLSHLEHLGSLCAYHKYWFISMTG